MQRIVLTLFICGISTSPQCSAQAVIPREYLFVAFSMGSNQYWAGRVYDMCVYYMTGAPEGSPKVVLRRSRESNLRPLVYKT